MKVLHVMSNLEERSGGSVASLRAYLAASASAGIATAIAAPTPRAAAPAWLRDGASDPPHLFRSIGRAAAAFSPALLRWLASEARHYDVVHVHGLLNPIVSAAARISIWRGVPVVVRPFGTMSRFTASYRRARLKAAYTALVDRPNLRRASAIHFTSSAEQEEAAWQGIDVVTKGRVVPPPYVGTYAGQGRAATDDTVVFLGRLHPVKNLETLIDAWRILAPRRPQMRLVIAGDGDTSYAATLRERARGLDHAIEFAGYVDPAGRERLLCGARLFVLPSHHENFGVAAAEAMAHGIPVVVSNEVHIGDFVRRHQLGITSSGDTASIASAMERALADDALAERCQVQGPARIREELSPEAIGRQLAAMYNFAAGEGR
jgi:glycosyltransferase involved in cell wall biosynthesis